MDKSSSLRANCILSKKQIYILLISICVLLYWNTFNNAFISDDIPAIIKNPFIAKPLAFGYDLPHFINSLLYLSFGREVFFYHLLNLIIHIANTILVFYFLRLFFGMDASMLGASLFAAHPVHTEAITWISGKPYSILSLFILSAYLLYNKAVTFYSNNKINYKYYIIALSIFSYYLFVQPYFYFLFPFFIIASDILFDKWKKTWKLWIPFLVIMAFKLILLRALLMHRIVSIAKEIGSTAAWANPLYNFSYSFFYHLWLLFWPQKLTLYHEPPVISLLALRIELVILFLLVISLPFIIKKSKVVFLGLFIFVLFLVPTYSPVMVSWLVAERYLYFPSVLLCILMAFFFEKLAPKNINYKRALIGCFSFIIAACAVRTVTRNEDWKTAERFWRMTEIVSDKSPRAYNNMADVYVQEGNTQGAINQLRAAIALKPDYADAYHNLGNVYYSLDNVEEAEKYYKQAIRFNQELFESVLNLAVIYLNKKEYSPARDYFKRALELKPDDQGARQGLDIALQNLEHQ